MTIQDTIIEPKRIPFKCPVCNGFGTLKHGSITCHACNGKGYIVVDNEERNTDERTNNSTT
jgi:DnaJ-class molecular chaperone